MSGWIFEVFDGGEGDMSGEGSIQALMPRSEGGIQFVAYGDCCICPPEPGRDHEQHLEAVHAVMAL